MKMVEEKGIGVLTDLTVPAKQSESRKRRERNAVVDAICVEVMVMGSVISGEGSVICTLINSKAERGAHGCGMQLMPIIKVFSLCFYPKHQRFGLHKIYLVY